MAVQFKKAERTKMKLKLALTGPSGSGKTMSALRIATGIGGKIAVIDTENESASLYSDRFNFDTCSLDPPYTTQKYLEALDEAIASGYDIVIIDSASHQWAGEGGVLQRKEQIDARGGNSFTNWGKMTPEQEKFKSAILHSDVHLIATMRSKQEYVLSENDKGKQAPKKVGLAPVQREGMEYEFTTVFDVAMNHEAATSKDRTDLFKDSFFQIDESVGERLRQWLETGVEKAKPLPAQQEQKKPLITPPDPMKAEKNAAAIAINAEASRLGWDPDKVGAYVQENFKKTKPELTLEEMKLLVAFMKRENAPEVPNEKANAGPEVQPGSQAPGA